MTNAVLGCVCVLALVIASAPARSDEQAASGFSAANSGEGDCETRMQKLDESQAEGEDRLREKYRVIDYCASQYENDKTIQRLAEECAQYIEQPVIKQQFFAECQLAAFNYANALYALKAEYGK